MGLELHERILLFLFERPDDYLDLYARFKNTDRNLLFDRARELRKKNFIDTEDSDAGIGLGWVNFETGETHIPISDTLFARITTDGIDHVKTNLLKIPTSDNKESSTSTQKIINTAVRAIGTILVDYCLLI